MIFSQRERDVIIKKLISQTREEKLTWRRGIINRCFSVFCDEALVLIGYSFWTGYYIQVHTQLISFSCSVYVEGSWLESSEEFAELLEEVKNRAPLSWYEKIAELFKDVWKRHFAHKCF
ncbi:MAG: hypothetical protein AAB815_02830 [Patescibacteria group bacterium]